MVWFGLLLQGCAFDVSPPSEGVLDAEIEGEFAAVVIDDAAGDVTVIASEGAPTLHAELEWRGDEQPGLMWDVEDGVLDVRFACEPRQDACSADLTLYVPDDVEVHADTGAGNVLVQGVGGDVRAWTGAGNIDADALFDADPRYGNDTYFSTGAGDIEVAFLDRPGSATADSGAGDVVVTVPAGAYQIHVSTSAGRAEVLGLVDDPDETDTIIATTGAGNVTVQSPR